MKPSEDELHAFARMVTFEKRLPVGSIISLARKATDGVRRKHYATVLGVRESLIWDHTAQKQTKMAGFAYVLNFDVKGLSRAHPSSALGDGADDSGGVPSDGKSASHLKQLADFNSPGVGDLAPSGINSGELLVGRGNVRGVHVAHPPRSYPLCVIRYVCCV